MRSDSQVVIKLLQPSDEAIGQLLLEGARGASNAAGQKRHRTAAMRPDPANIREAYGIAAETDSRDRARGVGPVFHAGRMHAGSVVEVPAAIGCRWMNKNDSVATVEFLHHRPIGCISQPRVAEARHKPDPVSVELIVSVGA